MARILPLAAAYPILCLVDVFFKVLVGIEPDFTLHSIKFSVALDMCFSAMPLVNSFVKNETFYSDVERIIEYVTDIKHRTVQVSKIISKTERQKRQPPIEGKIRFENVSYLYPGTTRFALLNLNIDVQACDRVALLGRVGSGKHTTLETLAGLTSQACLVSGRVYFDDTDVTFTACKYLGEQTYLLSDDFKMVEGTLRQNIDPQRTFADKQIIKVLNYLNFWKLSNRDSVLVPEHQSQEWDADPFKQDSAAGTNDEHRRSILSFHKHDTLMSIILSSRKDTEHLPEAWQNKRG